MYIEKLKSGSLPTHGGADASLAATADSLVMRGFADNDTNQFIAAAELYRGLLNSDALPRGSLRRAEIENSLGSVHCLIAQCGSLGAASPAHLDLAEHYLKAAIAVRRRDGDPLAWAITRTNIAIVQIARYQLTGNSLCLMTAHVALDEAAEEFNRQHQQANLDWVNSVRIHSETLRSAAPAKT